MPLVSVIVPTFNRAHTIVRCVESALKQTFQDFEVIVIDDGSTDNTSETVRQLQDPRVRLISNSRAKGPSGARNTGVDAATGTYVAFLDSDDEWLPTKLERQVSVMEMLSSDWCGIYSGAKILKNGNTKRPITRLGGPSGDVFKDYLLFNFSIPTPTLLYRRRCLNEVGPCEEGLLRMEDVEWNVRLLRRWKLACVREPLVVLHLNTRKTCAAVYERSMEMFAERLEDDARLLGPAIERAFRANRMFEVGTLYLRERQYRKWFSFFCKAMRAKASLSPDRIVRMAYGFVHSVVTPSNQHLTMQTSERVCSCGHTES